VPIFVAVIQTRFIPMEERFLTQKFGESYRQYCSRVRRWI
jgi:protein-S-isoprenylcysteine O-methyltransferase Ste14